MRRRRSAGSTIAAEPATGRLPREGRFPQRFDADGVFFEVRLPEDGRISEVFQNAAQHGGVMHGSAFGHLGDLFAKLRGLHKQIMFQQISTVVN